MRESIERRGEPTIEVEKEWGKTEEERDRYSNLKYEIESLEREEKLSKEKEAELEELTDKFLDLEIKRKKRIRELIGPQSPGHEWPIARDLGRESELFKKFYEEKDVFEQRWEELSPEERRKRGREAGRLQALAYPFRIEDEAEWTIRRRQKRNYQQIGREYKEGLWYLEYSDEEKEKIRKENPDSIEVKFLFPQEKTREK